MSTHQLIPSDYQIPLPTERFIVPKSPASKEVLTQDVLFIGAGPAGLAGAIELANLVRIERLKNLEFPALEIGVLEKAKVLGGHCLSGAIIDPSSLMQLFPNLTEKDFPFREKVSSEAVYWLTNEYSQALPVPPTMHNKGNYIISICELVRWLGGKAESLGVNILTGFAAESLIENEIGKIIGTRTTPGGLDRLGQQTKQYVPPVDIMARNVVLCEGSRGTLTQAYLQTYEIKSKQPQIYSLGVKEIWRVKNKPEETVIHTLGWPVPSSDFGGGFLYSMGADLIALGIVVGLDYKDSKLDVHNLLQELKTHPMFSACLKGGTLLEWGAKTIPEGGHHSLPPRLFGDGVLISGDAAGFVNVPSLKGIHYAIESGRLAAQTIFEAIKKKDYSRRSLASYDERIRQSFIWNDLYEVRNMRNAFSSGVYWGVAKAFLMSLSNGLLPGDQPLFHEDAKAAKFVDISLVEQRKSLLIEKEMAVYFSGNKTRDDIPKHLLVGKDITAEVADFYSHMCPANVYVKNGEELIINAPNCIDCKATDILGPRWTPREGGSGPNYSMM